MTMRLLGVFLICAMALTGCNMVTLRVIDDSNGTPVEGAQVSCQAGETKTKVVGKTDGLGELFFIPPKGATTVTIAKAGFQTARRDIASLTGESLSAGDVRLVPTGQEPSGIDMPMPKDPDEGFPK